MSSPDLRRRASDELRFLAQTVGAEADLLALTDGRVFPVPLDARRASTLREMTWPIARDLAPSGLRNMTSTACIRGSPTLYGMPKNVQDALAAGVPFPRRLRTPDEYAASARRSS